MLAVVVMSMKSLLNQEMIHQSNLEFKIWKPDEFNPSVELEHKNALAEDILKIFKQTAVSDCGEDINGCNKLTNEQSRKQPICQEWIPIDFNGTPPIVEKNVSYFQKEKSRAIDVNGLLSQNMKENEAKDLLVDARRQAQEIILQAQQLADDTYLQSQEEINQIKQKAISEGQAEGFSQIGHSLEAVRSMVAQVKKWQTEMLSASEVIVLDLVKQIGASMFGEGVKLDDEALQHNLNKVLRQSESLGDLRIYLNPQDILVLDPSWKKVQGSILDVKIQLLSSDSILPGGCFVQGQMGTVDARVETQLKAIMAKLEPEKVTGEDDL